MRPETRNLGPLSRVRSLARRFTTPRFAGGRCKMRHVMALCALIAVPCAGLAQETAREAPPRAGPDPMDRFCLSLGRPASRQEVENLSGASLDILADPETRYSEVLGNLREDRPRSNRYMEDGDRSANPVSLDGRRLCLTLAGKTEPDCGLLLQCTSGEAAFVLLSGLGDPVARVHLDGRAPQNRQAGTEAEDWITYAGGSFALGFEDGEPLSRKLLARSGTRKGCRIGDGFADIDRADLFFWSGADCRGGRVKAPGTIIHLDRKGVLGHVDFRDDSGLSLKDGMIVWDFPDDPLPVRLTCEGKDQSIPASAEEVAEIGFLVRYPRSLFVGEPVIYKRIVRALLPYVEKICGVPGDRHVVRVRFEQEGRTSNKPMQLTVRNAAVQTPTGFGGDAVEFERTQDNGHKSAAVREFRRHVVDHANRQYLDRLRETIGGNGRIPSLANAMHHFKVPTLVALAKGRTFRMPWQHPTFDNGVFTVRWRVTPDNPVKDYMSSKPYGNLWDDIRNGVSTNQNVPRLQVTCRIPEAAAIKLPEASWVTVSGDLVTYNGDRLILKCSAG